MWIRLALVLVAVAASGCATLFSSSSDEVTFTSEPDGARSIQTIGTTPRAFIFALVAVGGGG